jgi:hypothetical protein
MQKAKTTLSWNHVEDEEESGAGKTKRYIHLATY